MPGSAHQMSALFCAWQEDPKREDDFSRAMVATDDMACAHSASRRVRCHILLYAKETYIEAQVILPAWRATCVQPGHYFDILCCLPCSLTAWCQDRKSEGASSGAAIDAVVAEYPWIRYSRFVDIAGAYGSFLARLLNHVKAAEGVIFDQPQARARIHMHCTGGSKSKTKANEKN